MNSIILNDIPFFPSAATAPGLVSLNGTIGDVQSGADINSLPTSGYLKGEGYKVITSGTYAGYQCEVGDLIIATNDGPSSGSTVIPGDWTVIQSNIDGAVTSSASITQDNIVLGNGGKTVKDSGKHIVNSITEDDPNVPTAGSVDFYYKERYVGQRTLSTGEIFNDYAHNEANAPMSHVEGSNNEASQGADNAHVENSNNTTAAEDSHLEGSNNEATSSATRAHLEGSNNRATAPDTHVGGSHNNAGQANQTVVGTYNDNKAGTLFEVGNGSNDNSRSNAFEVYSDGHATVGAGPTNNLDVATKQYVDNHHDSTKLDSGNVSGLDTTATTIINAINELVANKQNANNVSALNTLSKSIVGAINEVNDVAKGAQQAISYNNYETMITAFNALPATAYNVSQNIMILTLDVPDLWVSKVESSSVTYTYTTDDAFIESLKTNNYVQVGYYKLSPLETFKIDLSPFIKGISIDGVEQTPDANKIISIPIGNNSTFGLFKSSVSYGVKSVNGILQTEKASDPGITSRASSYFVITPSNLDFAVKAAMTDNVGAAWTDAEQENARKRMGINMQPITQADYDALVTAGTVDPNTYYCIVES